jgi:hypothetical protein
MCASGSLVLKRNGHFLAGCINLSTLRGLGNPKPWLSALALA